MTAGKLAYLLYYQPRARYNEIRKKGLLNFLAVKRHAAKMKKRAADLTESGPTGPGFTVYFLTGKKYWYQTAFCLYSLQKNAGIPFHAVFVDDGSFDEELTRQMRKQFPSSVIRHRDEITRTLDAQLPATRYPLLRQKRLTYPHIRKLTDVHAGTAGWKMVLDSDMLFFRQPGALENWLGKPERPFFLYDPCESYHYSPGLMAELSGHEVIPNLNVGAIGLLSESIDWDALERWIGVMEKQEGSSYFLEQALSAMIVAGHPIQLASATDYVVMPGQQETQRPSAALHHYVADSKEWYFRYGWRNFC